MHRRIVYHQLKANDPYRVFDLCDSNHQYIVYRLRIDSRRTWLLPELSMTNWQKINWMIRSERMKKLPTSMLLLRIKAPNALPLQNKSKVYVWLPHVQYNRCWWIEPQMWLHCLSTNWIRNIGRIQGEYANCIVWVLETCTFMKIKIMKNAFHVYTTNKWLSTESNFLFIYTEVN